ncbi:hypothetical protein NDU88_002900 [Pleurodeles waltl]|uniref:Uncharacterized protein n=1 Tax=Pleurodeles waltl TaxID=8319 RepID=A0AAV7NPG2_PLEWA|nr:hypothetical protein NDU88_002900 [Pleurodeles waltl]
MTQEQYAGNEGPPQCPKSIDLSTPVYAPVAVVLHPLVSRPHPHTVIVRSQKRHKKVWPARLQCSNDEGRALFALRLKRQVAAGIDLLGPDLVDTIHQ